MGFTIKWRLLLKMILPMDKDDFSKFIEESNILILTKESLYECLENWYKDEPEQFIEELGADINTVMKTYRFENTMVSFNKNFKFEPPLDTISGKITICDENGDYCMTYQAIFDYDLNIIDDMTCY